jgi:tetratricopeptide (TPR) repeat protein
MRNACVVLALALVAVIGGCDKTEDEGSPTGGAPPRSEEDSSAPRAAPTATDPRFRIHRDRALEHFQNGDLRSAIAEARQAVALAPHEREAYEIVSRMLRESGLDAAAIELFAAAIESLGENGHAWYFKGLHELRLGRYIDSADSLRRAVELHPDDSESHFRLGTALYTLADYDAGLDAFRRAHELDPGSARNATELSRALRVVGDYDGAERVVREALEASLDSGRLRYALAQVLGHRGESSLAERELRRAIALEPEFHRAHQQLGRLLLRQGQETEGRRELATAERLEQTHSLRRYLVRVLARSPRDCEAGLTLAEFELSAGRTNAAAGPLRRAASLGCDPDRVAAAVALGHALSGNPRRAREALTGASVHAPRAALAAAAIAVIEGDLAAVEGFLDQAQEDGGSDRLLLWTASDLYARAGLDEDSTALLLRAVDAPSPVPEALELLASEFE